jgi:putative glutamine amidotransferase
VRIVSAEGSARPRIGIPTGYDPDTRRYLLDRRYVDVIGRAGGLGVIIPVPSGPETIDLYREWIDGVLLPGSPSDVDPARYGEPPHEKLGPLFPERDQADFSLLGTAEERSLPVLGICHGMQTLNVWRGGSLVQDIPSEIPLSASHQNPGQPRDVPAHPVRIEPGSRLARIIGEESDVNSFHHQAVRRVGRGLRIVARAPDGVAEAIEDPGQVFVIGVQWHPEAGWESSAASRALFLAFVAAAAAGGTRSRSDGID